MLCLARKRKGEKMTLPTHGGALLFLYFLLHFIGGEGLDTTYFLSSKISKQTVAEKEP